MWEIVRVATPLDGVIEEGKDHNEDADEEPHLRLERLANFEDLSALSCDR